MKRRVIYKLYGDDRIQYNKYQDSMSDNKMELKSESPTKKLNIIQNFFGNMNLTGDKKQNKRQSYSVLQPNQRDAYIQKQFVKDPNRRYKTQYANKQQQCFNWARYIQMSVAGSKSAAISKIIQNNIDKFRACIIYSSKDRVHLFDSLLSSTFRNKTIAINSKQSFNQNLRKAQKQNIQIIIINSEIVSESMRKTNEFSLPSAVNFILFDQICLNRLIFQKMISKSDESEPGVVINFVYRKFHSISLLPKQQDTVLETFTKQKKYFTIHLGDSQKKHYDLSQYFVAKQSRFSLKQQNELNINEQLSQADSNTIMLKKVSLQSKSEILQRSKIGQKSIIEGQQENSQEMSNMHEYDQLGKYIMKYIGKHIKKQFKLNIREQKQKKNREEIQQIKQYIIDSEDRNQKFIQILKEDDNRRKDIYRNTVNKLQQKIHLLQQYCKRIIKQRDNSNQKLNQYVIKLNKLQNRLYNENIQKKQIQQQHQSTFQEMAKYKSMYYQQSQKNMEKQKQNNFLIASLENHANSHSQIAIQLNHYQCNYQDGKDYILSYLQSERKRKIEQKQKLERSDTITFGLNRIKSSSSAKNEEQQQYKQQQKKKSIKELIEKCIKNSNKQIIDLMSSFINVTNKIEQEKINSKVIQKEIEVNDKNYGQKKKKIIREYFSTLKSLQKVIEQYHQYRAKQNKKKQKNNKGNVKIKSINSEQLSTQEYEKIIQNLKKQKQILQQKFSNHQKQVNIYYKEQLKKKDDALQDLNNQINKLTIEIETADEQKKKLKQSLTQQVSQLQWKLKLKQENTIKELTAQKQQQIQYLQRSHKQTVQENLKQFQQKTAKKEKQYQQRINQDNNQIMKLNNQIIRLSNQITRLNKENQNKINQLCFNLNKLRQILDRNFQFFNIIFKRNLKIQLNFTIDNYQNKIVELQKNLPIVLEKYTFLIQSELYRRMNEQRKKFIYDSIKSLIPKKIAYTKTLFEGYPGTTWDHWLLKVGNKPNILMLLRLKNGFEIAGFSENPFSKEPSDRGRGFIMSVTNLKLYNLKRGYEGKVAKYDQYIFGMGNNELLVKNNFKFNIIISRAYCHFDTANVEYKQLIGQEIDEGEFDRVEFYQMILE